MSTRSAGKVKLFRAPLNHRGTTDHLLKEALRDSQWPDYSSIIYLAPTTAKARDGQRRFHRLVRHPYIPPRFLTLRQMAMDLFSREMPGRHLPRILIPLVLSEISGHSIGFARVLSNLLMELKQHKPSRGPELIRQELTVIFAKLGIPDDAREKMDAAMEVFALYQKALSAAGYYDDDDILTFAASAAGRTQPHFSVLAADGFTDMTASEQDLLVSLMGSASSALISFPESDGILAGAEGYVSALRAGFDTAEDRLAPSGQRELSYVKYAGVEEEIEGVARHIKNLHVTGRLKPDEQNIITFPGLSEHQGLFERIFRRYGIPCSVSSGRPLSALPAVRDFIHLLDSVAGDYPRVSFTCFLSSPFFREVDPVLRSHIPSLSLRSGIIKGRSSWEGIGARCDDDTMAMSVDSGISRVFGCMEALASMRDSGDMGSLLSAVQETLKGLGFEAGDESLDGISRAMEQAGAICGITGIHRLSLKRYTDLLRHILGGPEHGHEDAAVRVMDFGETRGLEPDRLYFCGLKDGEMPAKPPVDLVLPDSVRTEYGLINLRRYLSLQKLDFLRLTGSARDIHLSYPGVEGDKVFLPSPFLPWAGEVPEKVYGVFSEEEYQTGKGTRLLADSISEIRIRGKAGERLLKKELCMPLRVTDIDAFRRCPRRFLIERVLGLEASEVAEYEIEARLLGTIVHSIMEELLKLPLDSIDAVRESVGPVANRIMEHFAVEGYWKRLIREAFLEMLPQVLELESELRAEGFFPHQLEMKVEGEVLPGIALKGKLDRIDRREAMFRILDYKTGSAEIGGDIIRKGKDLQLPLYAAMLRAWGMEIEKAGIYSLKEIEIKWIPTRRDKHTLEDYMTAALGYLEDTVSEMRKGSFRAAPLEDFICGTCPEAPFCPYIHARGGIGND